MSLLGAVKRLFVAEQKEQEEYDDWDCPHCGLGLSSMTIEKRGTEEKSAGGKFCSWCGWSPSLVGDEPDRTPEEAHRRAKKAHQNLGEMLEERGLR